MSRQTSNKNPRRVEAAKKRWAAMSPENRKKIAEAMSRGRDEAWRNLTQEERDARTNKLRDDKRKWWNGLSPEEQAERLRKRGDGQRAYFATMTPEEKTRYGLRFWGIPDPDAWLANKPKPAGGRPHTEEDRKKMRDAWARRSQAKKDEMERKRMAGVTQRRESLRIQHPTGE